MRVLRGPRRSRLGEEVKSESGYKTERGTTNVETQRHGTTFLLNDGSGPVVIDAREGVSAPMKESFGQQQSISFGDVMIGQFRTNVPRSHGEETVVGIKITESIFAPTGPLFAIGKFANGALTKPDGLLSSLEIHAGTRDAILGKSAKHAKGGLIASAAMFVPGVLFTLLFHAAPSAPDASCDSGITNVTVGDCTERLYGDEGKSFSWNVTKPGTFAVDVTTPKGAKISLDPEVTVTDAKGAVVLSGSPELTHALSVGTYNLTVKDETPGRAKTMSGGFGFTLTILETPDTQPVVAAASAAPVATTVSFDSLPASPAPAAVAKPVAHPGAHAASTPAHGKKH